jgi:hypothetical protein
MTAAAEIKAGALKARQEILKLDNQIHEEVAALEFAAFKDDRQPTAVELTKQAELERTQQELRKQLKILGFVTASKLDSSDDVSRLLERMQTVNAGLEDDLARLKKIERFAKIAAQVADAIAKVAERLAKIVASGAI